MKLRCGMNRGYIPHEKTSEIITVAKAAEACSSGAGG